MTKVKYLIVTVRGVRTISGVVNGEPFVADEDNPNWEKIVQAAEADDPHIRDLIEPVKTVELKFARLSERLTVRNRHVYWDGDRVDHALADQIVRFLEEDLDFRPLVAFYDKISQNPSQNSQKLLFNWLRTFRFTITSDGDILGYKGYDSKDGGYLSTSVGHAFVNDQEYDKAQIPCKDGDVVTMPRHEVVDNPMAACAAGLHVGTPTYSRKFGNVRVGILINPRDVVSVPEREAEKMRVCRYYVLGKADSDVVTSLMTDAPQWEKPAKKPATKEYVRPFGPEGGSILEDEPSSKKAKVVPQKAKDTLAERRGVMTPEEKKAKKREADRARRAKKKAEETPPRLRGRQGIKHENGKGYDWTLSHNMDLIRAANTNEELQAAFPDLSLSRLKHLKRSFSK